LTYEPKDAGYEARVRASFARQEFMATIGADLVLVEPGAVDIELPFGTHLTQQHGYVHAGAIAGAIDSACGYAALTLMDADTAVLTVEFKINLLERAAGERFVARGRVVRPGRTLTTCRGDAFACADGAERHVATVVATMISLRGHGRMSG
jgi:uncharacterized protein (TIGR00369 family)